MNWINRLAMVLLATSTIAAQNLDDRSKLVGTWQLADAGVKQAGVWTIEPENDDVLRITHSTADEKADQMECNTMGRECGAKDSGKAAKVSMWYSGPKLVVLESRGSTVVKRRFSVTDGDTIELEVIPIVPEGKTETLHLRRVRPPDVHQL